MSDDERGKELYDQDPDLCEDFYNHEWPFSGKGDLDDIPAPPGEACLKISNILGGASEHSGDFSFGGQAVSLPPIPGLFVDGVGPVPVPLWDERAQKLIEKCEKSPFGHKMTTKTDENVRKSWQLAPELVQFKTPQWTAGIKKMAVTIAQRLGYKDIPLQCVLYKLLVYGEGGHFVKHQDTEKQDGMIATLVVQPPSLHEGGDLVVYRDGEEKHRHDFGKAAGTATYLTHYAVHYADAEHAVEKVTKGYRLALVYSVCLPPTKLHLERNPNKPMSEALAEAIKTMKPGDDMFALLLSHEYTKQSIGNLGSRALKGVDRAFGDIGDWEEERDRRAEKTTWYGTDGGSIGSGAGKIKFNFLNSVGETLSQMWQKPFGSSYMHGYMGNEGPTKETTYQRYAIVAWPEVDDEENWRVMVKAMKNNKGGP
ncbi:hypothetical protein PC129_g16872 [Phytophthora cactorum]|uniref:Fe2OG dioxygenase domain-containing protein n=1 Tax=Phytophthora cactorum TaxID=29920 RepID=A0A329RX33_9STRA|nr:hypothetical protein Pcac1_g22778 [Phytophthora cactorum]KAG2805819.1 hypothetical protein PC111_g17645 [Phytophthora cactorum]KAG2819607.1 hypothetical protein PC112_g12119 [Phytophthora cactorum]KAG2888397.1 hypothetical protein PC114_g18433 [Phytophthora cactorum]KAG2902026.1 hypothetical protein PC115_g15710 [Phytophthora cactorum]